jgi:hypothetical protein
MVLAIFGIAMGALGVAFGIYGIGYWIGYANGIAVKEYKDDEKRVVLKLWLERITNEK